MKLIKCYTLLFSIFLVTFTTNAAAKSVSCTYGNVNFKVSDSDYIVNFSQIEKLPYTGYKHSVTINDFINQDNFYCPEKIYYKVIAVGNGGVYYYSFDDSDESYKNSTALSDSQIDNGYSNNDNEKTILKTCNYGEKNGYSINFFSDGSKSAIGLGSNSEFDTLVNQNFSYNGACPTKIYVSENYGNATFGWICRRN